MPPEPRTASGAAITFFVLAVLFGVLGLGSLNSDDDGRITDTAYRLGYDYGSFVLSAILLGIGLAVHARHRSRRSATADRWPRTYDQWQQLHQVWRATWLCRRCRVTFLPAAALRPDSDASPAIPVPRFLPWAADTAQQDHRPGTPTTSG
ncbi:hypothetical protein ABZW03_18035 [Kitasatospora sp. NPDC004799]|uniref:hypothetical protein n=1 Tax=Kitasatospora sp. NPDC004799 TaxID=3154460 RepID=UPI0033A991A9